MVMFVAFFAHALPSSSFLHVSDGIASPTSDVTTADLEGLDESRRLALHVSGHKGSFQQTDYSQSFGINSAPCIAFEGGLIGPQKRHWIVFEENACDHADAN